MTTLKISSWKRPSLRPVNMAGRARGYGLHTDSSLRFERGVDFELQKLASERATELIIEIAGGEAGPVVEVAVEEQLPKALTVDACAKSASSACWA